MTITIEVPTDLEKILLDAARSQGLDLKRYLEHLLIENLTPSERANAWRNSLEHLPATPPLSDESISRDAMYNDGAK